jgi:DNA topoisomerase-1
MHPDGGPVLVMPGKYGPYVKWGKVNATLPKEISPEAVSLEEALALVAEKAGKPGKKGTVRKAAAPKAKAEPAEKAAVVKKPAAKKAVATKAVALKAPAKKAAVKKATAKKPAAAKKPAVKKLAAVSGDVLE